MSDAALLAVVLAAVAGTLAGRAWAAASRSSDSRGFRASPHYTLALHHLTVGERESAISELTKVARVEPGAVEVPVVLGNLLREAGQVERAIQVHQALLARDLRRSERAQGLVCLATDFRKAGFLDRAMAAYEEVLDIEPNNLQALAGTQKLYEEQRQWRDAFHLQSRLSRLRKTDDSLVLGHLQAEIGRDAARVGREQEAEQAFEAALALDKRVFPAYLGLAELYMATDPRRAAAGLEEAIRAAPERAYLALDPLARAYRACGEPSRFVALCEALIAQSPREWRARVALARHLREESKPEEAYGLLLRAMDSNPQALLVHLEVWRTLPALGISGEPVERYVAAAEEAVFYAAPHICTRCRYRADEMLWRCPHCHQWSTFVEERLGPPPGAGAS